MPTLTKGMPSPFGKLTVADMAPIERDNSFQEMYMQNFVAHDNPVRHDGRYKLSEAEHWLLQAYAIQHMGMEQDEFLIALVYPENVPLDYMINRGLFPTRERDLDTVFVWEIYTDEGTVGNIKTTVGLWDNKNRIRTLWHEDEEDSLDPADVLSDGPDKWVHVEESRQRDGSRYESNRSKRTNYRAAGGPHLDKRQRNTGHVGYNTPFQTTFDERAEWREMRMSHYEMSSSLAIDNRALYERPNIRKSSLYKREGMDRAHAEEMMGPAQGD